MQMNDSVAALLNEKGRGIYFVSPDSSVYDAIELMSRQAIGAVLVMDQHHLIGVLSERDYARRVILKGRSSRDTQVADIMTPNPIAISPDACVEDCMRLMTSHHIRHLPVVDNGHVIGVLSIGDLVKRIITVQAETIQQMESYINGVYPA